MKLSKLFLQLRNKTFFAGCAIILVSLFMACEAAEVTALPDFTELVNANRAAVVNIGTIGVKRPKQRRQQPGPPPSHGMPGDENSLQDFFDRFFGGKPPGGNNGRQPHSSLGSGFIISEDGYVVSNYHVVREADEIIVRLSDRREYVAEIVGTDPRSDIAVLKVNAEKPLPVLTLGKSNALQVGEWVLAIGSPFGFDHSVTAGIVSAKGRSLPNENYVPFIQTDVAINPGNSGGPLFNLDGEVVGVNSQIYSRTGGFMGLSFAIPIDVVINVYTQLRNKGTVTRGWLGVLIQDVTRELAESFKMEKPYGALVSKVLPESPAAAAGLKPGDVIVKFNSEEIETSAELPPLVGKAAVGGKTPVEVIRKGLTRRLSVKIGQLPTDDDLEIAHKGPDGNQSNTRLNVSIRNLTSAEQKQLGNSGGVVVESVEPGLAFESGLRPGDIILQVNSQKITNANKFNNVIKGLKENSSVPVLIQRRGSPLFLAMKMASDN